MTEYIPGVCNIGPEEIKKRRQGGIIGLITSLIFIILVSIINPNPLWKLFIFFPVFIGSIGFLQTYFHFCAGFGLKGIYNVTKSVGNTDNIIQKEFRDKDKQKAQQIFALSVFLSLIIAIVFYLI